MRLTALAFTTLSLACIPASLKLGDDPAPEQTTADTDTTTISGDTMFTGSVASQGTSEGDTSTSTEADDAAEICDPSNNPGCPTDFICCSDDPATPGGKTPNFFRNGLVDEEYGEPIFAGVNNERGMSGRCIDIGESPSPFPNGCPVPCNPTWAQGRLTEICGAGTACCQFTEIDPEKDCILDPETQLWRAVTGLDIPLLTTWGDAHTTNQDRYGVGCAQFATDDMAMVDPQKLEDCQRQLTVADQRGFCYAPSCPCREDLCDMKNPGWVPTCP